MQFSFDFRCNFTLAGDTQVMLAAGHAKGPVEQANSHKGLDHNMDEFGMN